MELKAESHEEHGVGYKTLLQGEATIYFFRSFISDKYFTSKDDLLAAIESHYLFDLGQYKRNCPGKETALRILAGVKVIRAEAEPVAAQQGSWFTHSICAACWELRNPGRTPIKMIKPREEQCCFCGQTHSSGIYVRDYPESCKYLGEGGYHKLEEVSNENQSPP